LQSLRNFKLPRIKKYLWWVGSFLILFTVIGFILLPPLLKLILIKKLSENLHRQVTIQRIRINPYTLTLDIQGLFIKERNQTDNFFYLEKAFVNLASLSLIKRAVILEELFIQKPYLKIVRQKDSSYNFSDLIEKPIPKTEKKTGGIRFSFNNIIIFDGSIDFIDCPKDTTHTLRKLNLTIPFISNLTSEDTDVFVQPQLSASLNGKDFFLAGKTKPFADSLETNLEVNLKDIILAHYLPYLPMKLNFRLTSGTLDGDIKLAFIQHKGHGPDMELTGTMHLRDININDLKDEPIFRLSSAHIDLGSLRPLSNDFHITKITIYSPELLLQRDKNGAINLQSLVEQQAKISTPEKKITYPSPSKKAEFPYVMLDQFQIQGGKLFFLDEMPVEAVHLTMDNLNL